MAPATALLITFLALTAWRLAFAGPRSGPSTLAANTLRRRRNELLELRMRNLRRASAAATESRAQNYLRRVVALTSAKEMDCVYVLDIGTTRIQLKDGHVGRTLDVTDPWCAYEETCFYSTNKDMPKAEQIATALLQLKNNPVLFDAWAARNGVAFKADGQVFTPAR